MKNRLTILTTFYLRHKTQIFFFILLTAFIFLRFYELPQQANLGWDQADSAWAAKSILYDNPLRLQGVPIKGNADMFMGPLYYYLIAPFYFFTNLDMIASPIFAGVISVLSFIIFYFITKKLFNTKVAFVASCIYTFSLWTIHADRMQAAYILIPILSYSIFYFLYTCITGNEKQILFLAAVLGFGFHVHFTTIFYVPIILLALPWFPRTKKMLLYSLYALLIFLLFLSPMLYSIFFAKHSGSNGIITYLNASYHGFHLQRVFQMSHDAFISFEGILQFSLLRPLVFFVLPLFGIIFYFIKPKKERKNALLLLYLLALWIVVPWMILATYNGELTDYYFSLPRNLGIVMLAFLLMQLYAKRTFLPKLLVIGLLLFYAGNTLSLFFNAFPGNYLSIKQNVETAIKTKKKIQFKERDPLYYTYYIATKQRK